MCDRTDENQDPLHKISRQLSELASAQLSGQLPPEVEGSQWTQFSGIPTPTGPTSFPNLYPWNPVTVSNSGNSESLGSHHELYKANDSLRNTASSLRNGPSQGVRFPWQTDIVPSSPPVFHAPDEFRGSYSDVRGTGGAHSPQLESHAQGFINNPVFPQHQNVRAPLERFSFSEPLPNPSEQYASSDYSGLEQARQPLNLSPSSPFAQFSYNTPQLPSPTRQSPGHLSSFERVRKESQHSPSLNSTSPFTFPTKDYSLLTRSVPQEPTLDTVSSNYHQSEKRTSVDLDLGFNIEKRPSAPESEISNAVEGQQIYAEAFNKWLSFDSTKISPTLGTDFQNSSQVTAEPTSSDSSKPTYSDIAKTPKSSQSSVSKQDQPACEPLPKSHSLRNQRKDFKTSRPFVRRTNSGSKFWPRNFSGDDAEQPHMPTNSRYGLDSFDDKIVAQDSHNNSSDILMNLPKNKKEVENSAGGSMGTLDDITSGMSGEHVASSGDASSQTCKEKRAEKTSSPSSSINPSSSLKHDKKQEESLFFDPRRIFQTKSPNKSRVHSQNTLASNKPCSAKTVEQEHTVLNNGKPSVSASSAKLPTTARKHDYINNDLRDTYKLTNQAAAAEVSNTLNSNDTEHRHKELKSGSGKRSSGRSNSSSHRERKKSPEKRQQTDGGANYEYNANRGVFWSHVDLEKIEEWCSRASEKLSWCFNALVSIVVSLFIYILGLILYVSSGAVHFICIYLGKCWTLFKERVLRYNNSTPDWTSRDFFKRKAGLEENIVLPSTGDEAMKRLLSCKGKDPYSILGVKADSSDDDIKKCYRKQAVLVHPDKNQEPGAEEAFKILGHAFEMINDPVKRKKYDSHTQDEMNAEAMKAFAEMLSKLQAKIQEAANIMPCDNCGGKHRRFPVDRPFYSARYCERCNVRHAAKEGDVWAESTMLGFLWHYYALMEGHVYEITEWMKCHQEFFKHMKANDHVVVTRIAKGGNKKPRYRSTAEPNMEEFINRLFSQANEAGVNRQPPGPEAGWGQAGPASQGAAPSAGSKKSGRRNKKKRM